MSLSNFFECQFLKIRILYSQFLIGSAKLLWSEMQSDFRFNLGPLVLESSIRRSSGSPDRRGLTTGIGTMAFVSGSALFILYVRRNATVSSYSTILHNVGLLIGVGVLVGALILRDPPNDWTKRTAKTRDRLSTREIENGVSIGSKRCYGRSSSGSCS